MWCYQNSQVQNQEDVRWSDSLPSYPLHTVCPVAHDDQLEDSTSSVSSNENPAERENMPPGSDRQNDSQKSTPNRRLSNQTRDSLGTPNSLIQPSQNTLTLSTHLHNGYLSDHLNDSLRVFSRDNSMTTEAREQTLPEETIPFCNCPPDPEIVRGINLKHLTYDIVCFNVNTWN